MVFSGLFYGALGLSLGSAVVDAVIDISSPLHPVLGLPLGFRDPGAFLIPIWYYFIFPPVLLSWNCFFRDFDDCICDVVAGDLYGWVKE